MELAPVPDYQKSAGVVVGVSAGLTYPDGTQQVPIVSTVQSAAVAAGAQLAVGKGQRAPTTADGYGYSTSSIWQALGSLWQPVATPSAAGATWGQLPSIAACAADIVGATNTKFAGGLQAMLAGYTGAAIDISVTIASSPVTATINILPGGKLDVLSVQKLAARADAGTFISVTKLYDQNASANHAVKNASRAAPVLIWDDVLQSYCIAQFKTSPTTVDGQLQFPVGVATARNAFAMIAYGRASNGAGDGDVADMGVLGDWQGGANPIAAWQYLNSGGAQIANNPSGGNVAPASAVVSQTDPCIIGVTGGASSTTFFCNETQSVNAATPLSTALTGGWISTDGAGFGRPSGLRYTGYFVANVGLTAAQITAIKRSAYVSMNIAPQILNQLVLLADSRGTGLTGDYQTSLAMTLTQQMRRRVRVLNLSNGGRTAAQIATEAGPTSVSLYAPTARNACVILAGVNDFIVNGSSVATVLANLKALCLQQQRAGYYVILLAELNTTSTAGNANTQLPLLRAAILAAGTAGMNASAIVDVSALPSVAAPSNLAYYTDGLHPTVATDSEISSVLGPMLDLYFGL